METSFQRAIWPLTVTAAVFGLALIEYPVGIPRRFISVLYAIVTLSLQITMTTIKVLYLTIRDTIFLTSINIFMLGSFFFIICLLVFFSQCQRKRYYRCLEEINEIDKTLRGIGIETNYSRLRRLVVVTLVAWMSWTFLLNGIDIMAFASSGYNVQIYSMLSIFILGIPFHVPMIVNIHFWCLVGYAGTRFDCISNALKVLAPDDNDCIGWFRKNRVASVRGVWILNEKDKRQIWTLMHLHFQLCQVLRDINRVFEAQIFMEIGLSLQQVLCSVIFTFRVLLLPFEVNKYKYCILIWVWSFVYILKILITNLICENVSAKALTVHHTVIRLLRDMDDEEMREDLLLIGLQTKHNPLGFSCLGLNYFGYRFMCEIFSSMATTIVIILQLKTGLK